MREVLATLGARLGLGVTLGLLTPGLGASRLRRMLLREELLLLLLLLVLLLVVLLLVVLLLAVLAVTVSRISLYTRCVSAPRSCLAQLRLSRRRKLRNLPSSRPS